MRYVMVFIAGMMTPFTALFVICGSVKDVVVFSFIMALCLALALIEHICTTAHDSKA